jgi:RNA polymerase sigma factor (sigma-70 family)
LSPDDITALFVEIRGELLALLQRRTGHADIAADLAQDLFVRLSAIRVVLPDRQQARAYIFRMAVNLAIDRARSEGRRSNILSGVELLFENASPDPEMLTVNRDQIRRIDLALDELPPKCREVLMLARVYGLSHKEIAEKMGVSISLVEKYQLRALRHCRGRLDEEVSQ